MRVFRKVVLPLVWAVIFGVIAVSLATMAFRSDPKPAGSGLQPTGEVPVSDSTVGRGNVENTLVLQGTIVVDPMISAKASKDGVVNHFFVPVGAKVEAGDDLFQIKFDQEPSEVATDEADPPDPITRYVNVVAQKDGKVSGFSKDLDDPVAKGDVVATIRQDTFRATGSISPVDQYRLLDIPKSATVTITGGPAPFTCRDLAIGGPSAPDANNPSGDEFVDPAEEEQFREDPGASGGEGAGAAISCRVPENLRVFDGLAMTMSIEAGRAEDVLVVPVTAVRGVVDAGSVWVIDNGEPVEREVKLGLSDGRVVEVTNGLKEGEAILEFVLGGSPGEGGDDFSAEISK